MITVAEKVLLSIHPTANGAPVAVSEGLTDVVWSVDNAAVASVSAGADGSSAQVVPVAVGTVVVTVSAVNKAGVTLTDSVSLVFEPVPADKLGLTVDGTEAIA